MQLGMIGIGRMGGNMVRRLVRGGHECVVYNRSKGPVDELVRTVRVGRPISPPSSRCSAAPRVIWLMVPAAVVDRVLADITRSSRKATP